eukprot:967592-Pelagomonas_calceolata.AAC.3
MQQQEACISRRHKGSDSEVVESVHCLRQPRHGQCVQQERLLNQEYVSSTACADIQTFMDLQSM